MRVLPSEVVLAIELLIGAKPTDIDDRRLKHHYLPEVKTILTLLNDVPSELMELPFQSYLELSRCRAVLAATVARWEIGDTIVVRDVGSRDAMERIRQLMLQCRDTIPPPEPELPFITDPDRRAGIEEKARAAWIDFGAQEWLGATTFAGSALESLLLWAVEKAGSKTKKAPNDMVLSELVDAAAGAGLLTSSGEKLAHMARDARNLIHPGRVAKLGVSCTKASALTAMAALYTVAEELSNQF
ncbi:hypothetical protein S58_17240 [Bradyrhizobium oligotrophicum S58]|uniref:DUF4145 domain-containing protein n=1 Tax=Bradyrhizobium oligotrophicum S58 TaxID=1245469 RepID=M4Z4C4_9BRAD|nr:hypothetical protein [Bradyrhizobium oligotrophicum]BAM87731.1 hypothetical protein S58_17240 [Bradyrhizobium oligotrophicum S58]